MVKRLGVLLMAGALCACSQGEASDDAGVERLGVADTAADALLAGAGEQAAQRLGGADGGQRLVFYLEQDGEPELFALDWSAATVSATNWASFGGVEALGTADQGEILSDEGLRRVSEFCENAALAAQSEGNGGGPGRHEDFCRLMTGNALALEMGGAPAQPLPEATAPPQRSINYASASSRPVDSEQGAKGGEGGQTNGDSGRAAQPREGYTRSLFHSVQHLGLETAADYVVLRSNVIARTGATQQLLDAYAGLMIFVLAAVLLGQRMRSPIPLLVVLVFAVFHELAQEFAGRPKALSELAFSFANLVFWPLVLFALAQRWRWAERQPKADQAGGGQATTTAADYSSATEWQA